jgi:hypothetical protein
MSKKYIINEETKDFWGNKKYIVEEKNNNFDISPIIIIFSVFGVLVFYKFLLYKIYYSNLKSVNKDLQNKIDGRSFFLFLIHFIGFLPMLIIGPRVGLFYIFVTIILTIFGIIITLKRKGNFNFTT